MALDHSLLEEELKSILKPFQEELAATPTTRVLHSHLGDHRAQGLLEKLLQEYVPLIQEATIRELARSFEKMDVIKELTVAGAFAAQQVIAQEAKQLSASSKTSKEQYKDH